MNLRYNGILWRLYQQALTMPPLHGRLKCIVATVCACIIR